MLHRVRDSDGLAAGAVLGCTPEVRMLQRHQLEIARIKVPVKRKQTLDVAKVEAIAEDWLENGQQTPIRCRPDPKAAGEFILVEGYHRLEAARSLGETTILGFIVQGRVH